VPHTLPHTWRPLGVRMAVIFCGTLLLVVCVAAWFAIGDDVRSRVNIYQRVTMILFGLAAAAIGYALVRCRVTADRRGLVVINGFIRRDFEWPQVLAVRMPSGAPWATLDIADGTTVSALAIQSADGDRAKVAVRDLRSLLTQAEARAEPPPSADGPDAP
jgi:Bacterial PH domain